MGFELTSRFNLMYDAEHLGLDVMGLYCVLGAQSAGTQTPGWIECGLVSVLDPDGSMAAKLVHADLWTFEYSHDGWPGYRFNRMVSDTAAPWCRFVGRYARLDFPDRVRQEVYERDRYRCVACGAEDDLTLDHVWPFILGGGPEPENLQTMCRSCNSSKGARV